ncbi:MAG: biotin carboxylase N-terminal domain-containing protein, partial [Pseudomonadales bacterium]
MQKILINNRGEIACRVIRAVKAEGYQAVAVFSEADADSPFVSMADEAIGLRGNTPQETYLDIDAVIEAARRSGADAIHPGYGFLSENAAFASACQA